MPDLSADCAGITSVMVSVPPKRTEATGLRWGEEALRPFGDGDLAVWSKKRYPPVQRLQGL